MLAPDTSGCCYLLSFEGPGPQFPYLQNGIPISHLLVKNQEINEMIELYLHLQLKANVPQKIKH